MTSGSTRKTRRTDPVQHNKERERERERERWLDTKGSKINSNVWLAHQRDGKIRYNNNSYDIALYFMLSSMMIRLNCDEVLYNNNLNTLNGTVRLEKDYINKQLALYSNRYVYQNLSFDKKCVELMRPLP